MSQSLMQRAVSLLANREHSAHELEQKLLKSGFEQNQISQTLQELEQANLQSDSRFAEAYIRSRISRGYGYIRIRQELKEKGVSSTIINQFLNSTEIDWFELAKQVRCKRFGEAKPEDFKIKMKQQRFLQYRGFTHEQITESFIHT